MYKYIIIIISLIFPFSIQAANCTLKNVLFEGLNDRQIEVLKLSGARCTSTNVSGPKFGDPGFILIDGKRMDFLDVASEDTQFVFDIHDSKQIIYFYLLNMTEDTSSDTRFRKGYVFRTFIFEGKDAGYGAVSRTDPMLDMIISPNNPMKREAAVIKSMRKHNFKMLTKYRIADGLMKAEGKFRKYSNTNQIYFDTETIDLVSAKP